MTGVAIYVCQRVAGEVAVWLWAVCSLLPCGAFNVSIDTGHFVRCTSIRRLGALVRRNTIAAPFLRVNNNDGLLFAGSCRKIILRSHVRKVRITRRSRHSISIHMNTNII